MYYILYEFIVEDYINIFFSFKFKLKINYKTYYNFECKTYANSMIIKYNKRVFFYFSSAELRRYSVYL